MEAVNTSVSIIPGFSQNPVLREPVAGDGMAVNQLINNCPPLDGNSVYCNLLQCTHFSGTCVIAEKQGEIIGFTSAYLRPQQAATLFIWQIAVNRSARGQGLAKTMLIELLQRPLCRDTDTLETTIGPDNTASWKLFQGLAAELDAECSNELLFDREKHFHGHHPDENLLRVYSRTGPFIYKLKTNTGKLS